MPIGLACPFANEPLSSARINLGSGTVDMKKTKMNRHNKKMPAQIPKMRLPN